MRRQLLPSIAPITPTEDVTVSLSGGLFSSVTFGANLGVTNAEVSSDDESMVMINTTLSEGTERTFTITTNELSFDESQDVQSLGTLSSGEEVKYIHTETSDVYSYIVKDGEYYYQIISRKRAYTLEEMQETIDNILLVEYVAPYVVNVDNPQGSVSSLSFGAVLDVQTAECTSDSDVETYFTATFGTETAARTLRVTSMNETTYMTAKYTTANNVVIYYIYDAADKTRNYAWKIGENNSTNIYMFMISTTILSNDQLELAANNIIAEFNPNYEPPTEIVLTVDSEDAFVESVTLNTELGMEWAKLDYADSSMVQIGIMYPGEEYSRTLMISQMSMGSATESLGTTQDGVSVNYSSDGSTYNYEWSITDETTYSEIYIALSTSVEQTIEDIGFLITNMDIKTKSEY